MSSEDTRPLSEIPLEELKAKLQALRARRAQPRGTSASRTPGVIGPGETTARRPGRKRVDIDDPDLLMIANRIFNRPKDGEPAPESSDGA